MLLRLFRSMGGMPPKTVAVLLLATVAAVLLSMIVHELCHGLAAYALGDPTARRMGRLSLNPLKHLDPVGTLLLLFVGFGWAKPVQVDTRYFENPKRDMALVALAGPFSNFALAFLAVGGYRLTISAQMELLVMIGGQIMPVTMLVEGGRGLLNVFFVYLATLSVGLGVFNLIPIPPLDGSKVLAMFLPSRVYWNLMRYERYGMFLLIFLSMTGSLGGFMSNFVTGVLSLFQRVWF